MQSSNLVEHGLVRVMGQTYLDSLMLCSVVIVSLISSCIYVFVEPDGIYVRFCEVILGTACCFVPDTDLQM